MSRPVFRQLGTPERGGIVIVCDHASNHVPENIELGIRPDLLDAHIAWDIGVVGVAERMAADHSIPAHLSCVSRLVVDLNREEDSPGLIPHISDGHEIPGNAAPDRQARIEAFYRPYHDALEKWLNDADPKLILAIHSFTPRLESKKDDRPWEVGLLYNRDERAARHAIRAFTDRGFVAGDNQPYSGRILNATMNRHAEAYGRAYCSLEIRNDLIADETTQRKWATLLAEIAEEVKSAL